MAAAIAVVAVLSYANSLGNYFLIDDFWHLDKASKTAWSQVLVPWTYSGEDCRSYWSNDQRMQGVAGHGYFRPVVTAVYKVCLELFGWDARGYHLVNVLMHGAASVAAFMVARLFFRKEWVAASTGLLFATHPSHGECIQWVAANTDAIEGVFFLTGFAAFGGWLRQGGHWKYGLAVGCLVVALCTKESAVMLPVVLLAYDAYRLHTSGTRPRITRALVARHLPFWIILAGYLAIQYRAFSGIAAVNQGGIYIHGLFTWTFVPFVLANLTYSFVHLLVPLVPFFPINADDLGRSFGYWQVSLACVVLLGVLLWVTYRLIGRKSGWTFFPLFTVLTLAPVFPMLAAQRYLHVPSLGLCLALGALIERISDSDWYRRGQGNLSGRRCLGGILLLVILFNATASALQNVMWGLPSNLVREQVQAIRREVPSIPKGSSLYLLNLWPPAFGIEFILPVLYDDPTLDVQVLTIHPKILPLGDASPDSFLMKAFEKFLPDHVGRTTVRNHWDAPDRLRVGIDGGGYMRSLIEEIYPCAPSLQKEGARLQLARFSAEVLRADEAGVKELVFQFNPRATSPRTVLDLAYGRVRRLEPSPGK